MANESVSSKFFKPAEAGVPKRLMLGELLLLTTMFAVVFGLLTLLGAGSATTFVISLFIVAVSVGQALLFKGRQPRRSSFVAGAIAAPSIFAIAWFDEITFGIIGTRLHASGVDSFPKFCTWFLILLAAGLGLGYLAGLFVASWFFLCDRFRVRFLGRSYRPEFQSYAIDPDQTGETVNSGWNFVGNRIQRALRWLLTRRPQAPLQEALRVFLLVAIPLLVLSPYIPVNGRWPAVAFAVGCAYLTGGRSLGKFWGIPMSLLGAVALLPAKRVLMQVQYVDNMLGEQGSLIAILMITFGLLASWSICATVGWTVILCKRVWHSELSQNRIARAGRALTLFAIATFGYVVFAILQNFLQTPREQLAAKIVADNNEIWWGRSFPTSFDWRPSVVGIHLSRNANEHFPEFVREYGLPRTSGISITDPALEDETLTSLDGQRFLELDLRESGISDQAFRGISDVNLDGLNLSNSPIDNHTLERLSKLPGLQQSLTYLIAADTKITDMAWASRFQRLNHVDLRRCQIKSMGALAPLPTVSVADFSGCPIDDSMLQSIVAKFPNLTCLWLDETFITDKSIESLKQLNLVRLSIADTNLTSEGVEELVDWFNAAAVELE